jgi:hypothetical protein
VATSRSGAPMSLDSQSSTGLLAEYPYSPGYPEDYYSTLAQWLQQHLK